jgi:hypothetical protein
MEFESSKIKGGLMAEVEHDPTKNVIDLVHATIKRLDDIQILQFKRIDEKLSAEIERIEDLLESHIRHAKELGIAEKSRIDAIRAMDAKAIVTAAEQAHDTAKALASELATKTDGLRNDLNSRTEGLREFIGSVQSNVITQRTIIIDHLTERIGVLEKANYESMGKNQINRTVVAFVAAIIGGIITVAAQHLIVTKVL